MQLIDTTPANIRLYLLHVIAYLQSQQRSALLHGTTFTVMPSMVDGLERILTTVPEYEVPTRISLRYDDPKAEYAAIKTLTIYELLDTVFSLFYPVYEQMLAAKELDKETLFPMFLLAVFAHPEAP